MQDNPFEKKSLSTVRCIYPRLWALKKGVLTFAATPFLLVPAARLEPVKEFKPGSFKLIQGQILRELTPSPWNFQGGHLAIQWIFIQQRIISPGICQPH